MGKGKNRHKPRHDKNDAPRDSPAITPTVPDDHIPPESHCCEKHPRRQIVLDVGGVVAAIVAAGSAAFALYYFKGQWSEMQMQTTIQRNATFLEERAWLDVSAADITFSPAANGMRSVSATMAIKNNGKTPARRLLAEITMRLLRTGTPCVPYYRGQIVVDRANLVAPEQTDPVTQPITVPLESKPDDTPAPPLISQTEWKDLTDGQDYIVIYGRMTYQDVFSQWHWQHFCTWKSLATHGTITSAWCSLYGDMDTTRLSESPTGGPPADEPYMTSQTIQLPGNPPLPGASCR